MVSREVCATIASLHLHFRTPLAAAAGALRQSATHPSGTAGTQAFALGATAAALLADLRAAGTAEADGDGEGPPEEWWGVVVVEEGAV